MTLQTLATIYLDNQRVGLMGDPRPSISKIVVAGGKRPELVQVYHARFPGEAHGTPVGFEQTIDRLADPTVPVYLTCVGQANPFAPGQRPLSVFRRERGAIRRTRLGASRDSGAALA